MVRAARKNRCSIAKAVPILALLVCLGLEQSAQAAVTAEFDVFNSKGSWASSPFYTDYRMGQTFVATVSGTLTSVELVLNSDPDENPAGVPLTLDLYTTGGNRKLPTGPSLASGTLAYDDSQFDSMYISWIDVDMSPTELVAGQGYAIIGSAPSTNKAYSWYFKYISGSAQETKALYPDGCEVINSGTGWAKQGYDLGFRINVDPSAPVVPVPGALALGLIGLGIIRRHRLR